MATKPIATAGDVMDDQSDAGIAAAATGDGDTSAAVAADHARSQLVAAPDLRSERRQPIGNIEQFDADEVRGWAWDAAHPDDPVEIEIVEGDEVLLRLTATHPRSDLLNAGMGNGRHGFVVRGIGAILPLSRHRVRVRRVSDGVDLPGSPAWITRPFLDGTAITFIDQVIGSAVQLAQRPQDLYEPLAVVLGILGELIDATDALSQAMMDEALSPIEIAGMQPLTAHMRDLIMMLQADCPVLRFPDTDAPVVSVIIPVHNKFEVTYDCLKSILAALPQRGFEIIIVDDNSSDATLLASLVLQGEVRVVRNKGNLGFVLTCNAGAAVARGRYLLFLNNDTLVKDNWLDALVDTFEQIPNIGIAGSRLLFPDGTLQEAGGIIWRLGDGWNWGRGKDPADPAFSYLRDADWASGAALMIERDLFNDLNGFDELYVPAYYEDTDLAFRVRALGKRVVVQPASEIVHLEGVSNGTDTAGTGLKRYQVINHTKFYQRWKHVLTAHRLNGEQPELEAERAVGKRAYYIDDSVPTPDQDAGSNAALEHMKALQALGYKVTFLPADNMAPSAPYTGNLQKLGIECLYYPQYWSVEEVFRKARVKPDLVYLHRYSNASKYATIARRYFPACRIVYSVADLHFLRMEREAALDPSATSTAQAAAQRHDELLAMQGVDSVIVHSPVEAALLHEADPRLYVAVVPWTVTPRPSPRPFAERSGAAFIGGFGHPPNLDAVRHFVADIAPALHLRLPDCVTYIAGSKMPDELKRLHEPGIVPVGFVPVLADLLHQLRCTVVPLRYGAGIKGKVLESFAHGLPCIMSEIAAEGLELEGDLAWLVARSPQEFVEKVASVHRDEGINQRLAEAGLAYIAARHSAVAVEGALGEAVRA